MPPKARALRKGSTTSRPTAKDAPVQRSTFIASPTSTPKTKFSPKAAGTMPPPPPPAPATILGLEMLALEESLKEAALNTGRIFRFYADVRKERIVSHAPYPPKSLTRALGHSLERYDQICDTIEAQLLHAIAIFERDLRAEQARLDAEASAAVATRTRSKRPSVSPTASRIPLPNASPPPGTADQQVLTDSPTSMIPTSQVPPFGAYGVSVASRRQSAILSSLHRPSFPLKLDLSPAVLAGNADPTAMGQPMDVNVDLGLTSLPSPVTLAPKTARALTNDSSIPDIFGVGPSQEMSIARDAGDAGNIPGAVGMETTSAPQENVIDLTGPEASGTGTAQLGDSADKPIELDLEGSYDNMDLFGDVQTTHDARNAANASVAPRGAAGPSTELDVDMEELFTPQETQASAFQLDGVMNRNDAAPDPGAILASLTSGTESAGPSSNELSSLLPNTSGHAESSSAEGLPGTTSGDTFAGLDTGEDAGTHFDLSGIDLSSFGGLFDAPEGVGSDEAGVNSEEMDIMSLLAMDGGENVQPPSGENTGT